MCPILWSILHFMARNSCTSNVWYSAVRGFDLACCCVIQSPLLLHDTPSDAVFLFDHHFQGKIYVLSDFPIARKSPKVAQSLLSLLRKNMRVSFVWKVCTGPWKFAGSMTMPISSGSEKYLGHGDGCRNLYIVIVLYSFLSVIRHFLSIMRTTFSYFFRRRI